MSQSVRITFRSYFLVILIVITENAHVSQRVGPAYAERVILDCNEGYTASVNISSVSECKDGNFSEFHLKCDAVCETPQNYLSLGIQVTHISGEVRYILISHRM